MFEGLARPTGAGTRLIRASISAITVLLALATGPWFGAEALALPDFQQLDAHLGSDTSSAPDTSVPKWNRFETKPVSGVFAAALIVDRQHWLGQDRASKEQVGDLGDFEGGEIRGFRIGVVGTFNFERPWSYTFFMATNAYDKGFDTQTTDDVTLVDWRVDIPLSGRSTLSLGKQKEPISLGRLMIGMAHPGVDERPAVLDAMLPSRNVGAVLSRTFGNERSTVALGVFNNWMEGGSISRNATQLIGRVTWLPYLSPDESGLVHVGAGYRYSDAREGFTSATEPEFNQSPAFVVLEADRADQGHTYSLETLVRRGPWMVMGEYLRTDIFGSDLESPAVDGYYVAASWLSGGAVRPYSKRGATVGLPSVAHPTSAGGGGAWEVAARYSHLDGNDFGLLGGEMGILSLGGSWWLTQTFAVGAALRYVTLDRNDLNGASYGLMTRIVLALE